MNQEEQKEKYSAFISDVSEIFGFEAMYGY